MYGNILRVVARMGYTTWLEMSMNGVRIGMIGMRINDIKMVTLLCLREPYVACCAAVHGILTKLAIAIPSDVAFTAGASAPITGAPAMAFGVRSLFSNTLHLCPFILC